MPPPYQIDYSRLFNVLDVIKESSKEQMVDVNYVEQLICQVGLHNDPAVSANYGEKYQKYLTDHGMLQQPKQFAEALVYLSDKKIRSYVEVGTFNGMATGFIFGYFTKFNPRFVGMTIDITERYNPNYAREMMKRFEIYFITEDSNNIKGDQNDLCFIDGDHNYKQVKADYENIGHKAKYCMFHDICDSFQKKVNDGGSLKYWEELKLGTKFTEFTYNPTDVKYFGIGIIDQT